MGLKISRKNGTGEDTLLEIAEATTASAGLMSSGDKMKLNGVASGAEVNQNAFGKVVVGETTMAAGAKVDTLTLAAGSNVTLAADATTRKLTISSKNTTYTAATVTPKAAGTAATGTSARYAREDHVHPAQTSVSGNAGSATKLATARTIALTGDVTGSVSFNGSSNVSLAAKMKNAVVQSSPAGARDEAIAADTDYAVPAYVVGSGRLQVFLDGVLCAGGTDAENCVYQEVGTTGKESAVIQFHQAISTDYEILVRVQ